MKAKKQAVLASTIIETLDKLWEDTCQFREQVEHNFGLDELLALTNADGMGLVGCVVAHIASRTEAKCYTDQNVLVELRQFLDSLAKGPAETRKEEEEEEEE